MPGGTVTMLFTDVVGSTDLLSRLGDDAAEQLRRSHVRLLRDAVAERGGHEVKNLGDGLMVAFPSTLDAISCAVGIQQAVARHNQQPRSVPMQVRVGLHVGEPIVEGDDYFGSAVVIAKRLCDASQGGQIIVSELVRGIIGSRGSFSFKSLGKLELKGLQEPLPAAEVVWERDRSIPAPAPVAASEMVPFVGRTDALQHLRSSFAKAAAGNRQMVLIAGEPGVGKTRLALEFAREAFAGGATVLFGRSDEEPLVPYQPFVEALRNYATAAPAEEVRKQLGTSGHELRRLVPELGERFSDLSEPFRGEPDTERYRLFEAVASFIDAVAVDAPVVLVLDDLHWADRPSLLLLRHMVRGLPAAGLLVVGTYRDVELDRHHPLADVLADLRRAALYERVLLRGLSVEEVIAMLELRAGHEIDEPGRKLAAALHAETEGNPFFIRELIRHLVETGGLRQQDGRWTIDGTIEELGLPESVREVIGRRLSRLSDVCNNVLRVAAIIGREFAVDLLERVADVSGNALLDAVDEAVSARVILESPDAFDRYTFSHALVRDTLYGELTTSRRVRLHRRIGHALEEIRSDRIDDYLADLALHFREAAPLGEVDRAVMYGSRAGERAFASVAYEEAVDHYQNVLLALELKEPSDEELRCDALLALGRALAAAGTFTAARETFLEAAETARKISDPNRLASAALGFGGLWVEIGIPDPDELALLEAASNALGDADSILKCKVLSRLAMELAFTPLNERARVLTTESVAMARRLGDPPTLAYSLLARRHAVTGPRDLGERLAITTESVALAEAVGEKEMALRTRAFLLIDAAESGDRELLNDDLDAVFKSAEELRQPRYDYVAELFRAGKLLREGRFAEASERARRVMEIARSLERMTGVQASQILVFAAEWERGRLPLLEQEVRRAVSEFSAAVPLWNIMLPLLDAELGRMDDARRGLEVVVETLGHPPNDWTLWTWCAFPSYVCALLGDRAAAEVIFGVLSQYGDRHFVAAGTALVSYLGPASLYLGTLTTVLGRFDEAERYFKAALPAAESMRAPSWAARARFHHAEMLLRRGAQGDRDRALELLDRAQQDFAELGMESMLQRTAALRQT